MMNKIEINNKFSIEFMIKGNQRLWEDKKIYYIDQIGNV